MKIKRSHGRLMLLCAGALMLAAQLTATAQVLTHRYSFFSTADNSPTVADSVGSNTGVLTNNGVAGAINPFISNGQLVLAGAGDYLSLESGIITNDAAVTVEAWGDFSGGQNTWANLFDFGTQDINDNDSFSISFCVNTGGNPANDLDAAISDFDNANVNRENCYAPGSLIAGNVNQHVVAVFNPPAHYIAIFVNGTQVQKLSINSTITPGVRDVNNKIGWDNWPDPTMAANLNEFRVWNGALDGLKIAASFQGGFTNVSTNFGTVTGITITAGAQLVLGGQEPATVDASATGVTNVADVTFEAAFTSGNTNVVTVDTSGSIHGIKPGTTTVSASFGGKTNSTSVTVVEPVSILAHRYSFNDNPANGGVADSIGGRNGLLMGTATETGGQLILDGTAGCYVDLSSNAPADNGIISGFQSATIDYWATFGDLQNWSYAFAFGNTVNNAGQNYIHSVSRDGNTQHEIDNFTTAGGSGVTALGVFANTSVHVTTVVDVPSGHLSIYTNGILSGFVTNDFAPLSSIATNLAYIGRSLWTVPGPGGTGDPYLIGSFDEIRVYNGTLTPQQIAIADLNGPNNTNIAVGTLQSIHVSIPTLSLNDQFTGGVLANYSNLTNFDVVANNAGPLLVYTSDNSNVVFQSATSGRLRAVGVGTATITASFGGFTNSQLVTVVDQPVLEHRYSFQDAVGATNAADSVGGSSFNGFLPNGGTFSGTNLQLSGASDQYVQLPAGILSNYNAVTIDMWFQTPTVLPVNCMLYAFGDTDTNSTLGENYIFCAPQRGYIAISGVDPGFDGEQGVGGGGDFSYASNSLLHLTSVFDPAGRLEVMYTNGILEGQNTGITIPMSFVADKLNYIGHSVYEGDPHEDLNLTEFRIYKGALTQAEVTQAQAAGPSVVPNLGSAAHPLITATASAGNIKVSWPSSASKASLFTSPTIAPNATWTAVNVTPTTNGGTISVTVPITGGTKFFRLQ